MGVLKVKEENGRGRTEGDGFKKLGRMALR